jgi:transposase-like protein
MSDGALHDEARAYELVESVLWPNGPECPHCGSIERISKMHGKSTRIGVYKCYACRSKFTVKIGTIFEDSHIPMRFWLQAIFLMASSKKGVSSNQLHRTMGISLRSAWFMSHRIREAMRSGGLLPPMGSGGGIVEIDDTAIGRKKGVPKRRGYAHKHAVMTLIDRKAGEARSFHVKDLKVKTIEPIIKANISREAQIASDEASRYVIISQDFARHESVQHARDEYVRGEWHSNTVEGFFSVFKRGMKGVYQHCGEKHLHRYLAEFDFRYNARVALGVNDKDRAEKLLRGVKGKRLTYR